MCVCQYFSPYASADLTKMARAFHTSVAALEEEVTQLILEGVVDARIDSHSKVRPSAATKGVWFSSPQRYSSFLIVA